MPRVIRAPFRVRAKDDGEEGVVEAYASVFDVDYRVFFDIEERIERGAFAASLDEQPSVPIFYEHGWRDGPIGVTTSAEEDDVGLRVTAQLFLDDPRARSVWRALQAGALREWSIGFIPETIRVEKADDGELEVIEKAELLEASVVVRGANPETETVAVRSNDELRELIRSVLAETETETETETPELVERAWSRLDSAALRIVLREMRQGAVQ